MQSSFLIIDLSCCAQPGARLHHEQTQSNRLCCFQTLDAVFQNLLDYLNSSTAHLVTISVII